MAMAATTTDSGLAKFFAAGLAHIQRIEGSAFAVVPYSPEWDAWAQYLHRQHGVVPAVFAMAERKSIPSVTMPAQWPELYDSRYIAPTSEPPRHRSAARQFDDDPDARQRVLAMVGALQRELGAAVATGRMARPRA